MRIAIREATWLFLAALFLSLVFTASVKRGLFRESVAIPSRSQSNPEIIPPATITLEDAKRLQDLNDAVFVDARHEFDYKLGHIAGAINLPLSEFTPQHPQFLALSKSKHIVVYCDGAGCNSSIELAAKLYEHGFAEVKIFFGGWQEWNSAHLPVERNK